MYREFALKFFKFDMARTALAVSSGLLLTATFPKFELNWLAWVAVVPLLIAIKDRHPGESFRLGMIAGLAHFLSLLYWLIHTMQTYGNLPLFLSVGILFLFACVLGFFVAVFTLGVTVTCHRPIVCLLGIPTLWVALEYLRSFIFTGFPWELLGYSQYKILPLIQLADITGVYGISFLIVLTNAAIFVFLLYGSGADWQSMPIKRELALTSLLLCIVLLVATIMYGRQRITAVDTGIQTAPTIRASVVQGNIEQGIKWDPAFQLSTVQKHLRLSLATQKDQPDLVVWPETATSFYFPYDQGLTNLVQRGIVETGSDFLIGSPSFERRADRVKYYNSAYLVDLNGQIQGKYDKAHLVPFGEYVPFKKWLPFLGKIVAQVGDFYPGPKGQTIAWRDAHLGVLICYEGIFPYLARAQARNQATLLIIITNDAWYGRSSAPYQHFSMAVFRAVETRRALIRSANTGISGFIDPAGRILQTTPLFEEKIVTQQLPLLQVASIYTRYGDFLAIFCLIISLGLAFMGIKRYYLTV
ncbi:MAG: apolipoprotein N-acyltransferase [Desulfobacterales bacterium]|nr:apolipoprotein N-acyltransferase [Desulfobacterales bacterium]